MIIKFFYEVNLKFYRPELEYLETYIRFMLTIKHIIDKEWKHDKHLEKLPNPFALYIEERLKRIERSLKDNFKG